LHLQHRLSLLFCPQMMKKGASLQKRVPLFGQQADAPVSLWVTRCSLCSPFHIHGRRAHTALTRSSRAGQNSLLSGHEVHGCCIYETRAEPLVDMDARISLSFCCLSLFDRPVIPDNSIKGLAVITKPLVPLLDGATPASHLFASLFSFSPHLPYKHSGDSGG
jgi:hypothetical protein